MSEMIATPAAGWIPSPPPRDIPRSRSLYATIGTERHGHDPPVALTQDRVVAPGAHHASVAAHRADCRHDGFGVSPVGAGCGGCPSWAVKAAMRFGRPSTPSTTHQVSVARSSVRSANRMPRWPRTREARRGSPRRTARRPRRRRHGRRGRTAHPTASPRRRMRHRQAPSPVPTLPCACSAPSSTTVGGSCSQLGPGWRDSASPAQRGAGSRKLPSGSRRRRRTSITLAESMGP